MKKPQNRIEALRQKLTRKDQLIHKWTNEADACNPSDAVGRAVKRYCQGLARWQQEERDMLEAEMRELMQKGHTQS